MARAVSKLLASTSTSLIVFALASIAAADPSLPYSWSAAFGWSIAGAGDVDGDGYDDILIGQYPYNNGQGEEGRADLYRGAASGPGTSPDWTVVGVEFSEALGYSVAWAGDVNADGFDDILVGEPGYAPGPFGIGRALVFHGAASGPATVQSWEAAGDQSWEFYASAVASAGDVNGDGYDDIIVGSPAWDCAFAVAGRTHLFLGSASGLEASPSRAFAGDQEQQEGIPDVIPPEACYLGWQESLDLLAKLVEADIPG